MLFVTSADQTSLEAAETALNELSAAGARLLGAVLNRAPLTRESFYYARYYRAEYEPYLTPTEYAEPRPSGWRASRPPRARHERLAHAAEPGRARRHAVFLVLALQRPPRAVLLYAVLGATPPVLQLGAFSGRNISQGLLLAEALATVLFAVVGRPASDPRPLRTAFDWPARSPLSASGWRRCSAILLLPDHRVETMPSSTVSVGQILLVLWPIGVYLAARDLTHDDGAAALDPERHHLGWRRSSSPSRPCRDRRRGIHGVGRTLRGRSPRRSRSAGGCSGRRRRRCSPLPGGHPCRSATA